MIGSEILVLPDIGPDFLRALKAASLYSTRVHTCLFDISFERLSPLLEKAEEHLRNQDLPEPMGYYLGRISRYFRFGVDNERTFRLLSESGILPRLSPDRIVQGLYQPTVSASPQIDLLTVMEHIRDSSDPGIDILKRTFTEYPPNLTDLVPLLPFLGEMNESWASLLKCREDDFKTLLALVTTVPEFRVALFALFLTLLCCASERDGIAVLVTSELHQQSLWAARELFGIKNDRKLLADRKSIQALIGDTVIQRYLPDVDSLEFEDILELRTRCRDELEAFRIGLREIAVQVDTTQPIDSQRLQIEDIITTKVDPAVRNLQVSLWAARAHILKRITSSWDSLAKATVPFLVSVAVGAPMNMQAALAAIGGFSALAGPFIESEVERRKLLHASQWSVLLKLKNLGS
jgi:hypothetical protein